MKYPKYFETFRYGTMAADFCHSPYRTVEEANNWKINSHKEASECYTMVVLQALPTIPVLAVESRLNLQHVQLIQLLRLLPTPAHKFARRRAPPTCIWIPGLKSESHSISFYWAWKWIGFVLSISVLLLLRGFYSPYNTAIIPSLLPKHKASEWLQLCAFH